MHCMSLKVSEHASKPNPLHDKQGSSLQTICNTCKKRFWCSHCSRKHILCPQCTTNKDHPCKPFATPARKGSGAPIAAESISCVRNARQTRIIPANHLQHLQEKVLVLPLQQKAYLVSAMHPRRGSWQHHANPATRCLRPEPRRGCIADTRYAF